MRFSSVSVLALSGAAAASSIAERQVQTIINVVNNIGSVTQALDTAVKGFSGDPKELTAASQKVTDTVTSGVATIKGASSISMTDSVQIQSQVQNLQSTIESVVSDLIAKKDALVSAGQGQVVETSLTTQLQGAKDLQAAITSKVPPEIKSIAATLSAGINTSLEKGVAAFKDTPGASAGGSSSSGSSAPASAGSSSSTGSSGSSSSGGMASMPGMSSSGSTGTSGSSGSSGSASSASTVTSTAPKPATYTGAAAPRAVAGVVAGAVALGAIVFAL